jgi:lauroyl/myristoyl acyltransferase
MVRQSPPPDGPPPLEVPPDAEAEVGAAQPPSRDTVGAGPAASRGSIGGPITRGGGVGTGMATGREATTVRTRGRPAWPLRVGLLAATFLVRRLGGGRYLVADALGTIAYVLARRRRRTAMASYRRLQPEASLRDLRRLVRGSFRQFARTGIDFLWANGMEPDEVLRHSVVIGQDLTDRATARGRGGVLALTHFGNWDMAAVIAHAIGLELTTVMADTGPRAITDLVLWARERNFLEVFVADRAALGLMRALRRNRFVAIISDLPESGPTVVADYCGGRVRFSSVPAWLAIRTGALLLPTACWRERGKYHIAALDAIEVEPDDDEASLMQRVAATIEPLLRARPTQWYPFRWPFVDDVTDDGASG